MSLIYGTNATISIKNKAGEWEEIETETTDADLAAYLNLPGSFEFEVTCTWRWVDPWAFALPPAGMLPMYN